MKQVFRDPIGLIVNSVLGFKQSDGIGVSAEVAYRLVIALPALVIVFTSASSAAAEYTGVDAFELLLDRAREALPFEVYSTLQLVLSSIREQSGIGVFSIGLAIAIWSGSNAVNALLKGINRAHDVEDVRGFVHQRFIAFGLMIGLGVLMLTSFTLLIFGGEIRNEVGSAFGLGAEFELIWDILRWPLLLALFMSSLAMLYWAGPARYVYPRAILPGAIWATIFWVIATYGFSIYLSVVDPESAYGIVGSLIALMLFLYISSIVILFGAEINATVRRRIEGSLDKPRAAQHPADIMSPEYALPREQTGSRIAAWMLIGLLIAGAALGSLFRRNHQHDGASDLDL
jgi:membrane protein